MLWIKEINIKEVDIERIVIENLIFKFFKKDIGSDVIFDYYESFSIKDNSYLKLKLWNVILMKSLIICKEKSQL